MAASDHSEQFPDIDSKLSAPRTLSAYGREKQAQEAKRQRAEIEDAEALRRFEEEFGGGEEDDDSNAPGPRASHNAHFNGPRGYGGMPGRMGEQFLGPRGGPGSLGTLSGLPPPPSLKRKRAMEEAREAEAARREEEEDKVQYDRDIRESREEPIDIAPKPTLQLSHLPPGTHEETVLDLLQPYVEVYSVEITPALGVKRTDTAVATLEHVVKQSAIDAAVTALRDKYLGGGYFLSIARHLSSTVLRPNVSLGIMSTSDEPFGARRPKPAVGCGSLRNAPPPSQFAPPGSYEARSASTFQIDRTVPVTTSLDAGILGAIHIVSDRLLSEPDPGRALKIEALLMGDPTVFKDERFAFLYDSYSLAGVYYRYLLWSDHSEGASHGYSDKSDVRLFEDVHYGWPSPHPNLPFVGIVRLGDVMENIDYNSDEEESDDEDEERRFNSGAREAAQSMATDEHDHLTPSQQARLAWLLSQLPTTHTMLRSVEVANITNFAIAHASAGSERIVDMLTLNVQRPFSSTSWAKDEELDDPSDEDISDHQVASFEAHLRADGAVGSMKREADDPSHAKLIGLYVINDILLNAVTAGAKGAWKYRQLFEASFLAKKTFEYLGQLDKELSWGRMRSEQWKNKITFLLDAWEKQNVFKGEVHKELRKTFLGQSGDERGTSADLNDSNQMPRISSVSKAPVLSRFKKVDGSTPSPGPQTSHLPVPSHLVPAEAGSGMDYELPDAQGVDVAAIHDTGDTPMKNADGTSAADVSSTLTDDIKPNADIKGASAQANTKAFSMNVKSVKNKPDAAGEHVASGDPKRRMRAEDMFADSDEE